MPESGSGFDCACRKNIFMGKNFCNVKQVGCPSNERHQTSMQEAV